MEGERDLFPVWAHALGWWLTSLVVAVFILAPEVGIFLITALLLACVARALWLTLLAPD